MKTARQWAEEQFSFGADTKDDIIAMIAAIQNDAKCELERELDDLTMQHNTAIADNIDTRSELNKVKLSAKLYYEECNRMKKLNLAPERVGISSRRAR